MITMMIMMSTVILMMMLVLLIMIVKMVMVMLMIPGARYPRFKIHIYVAPVFLKWSSKRTRCHVMLSTLREPSPLLQVTLLMNITLPNFASQVTSLFSSSANCQYHCFISPS